MKIGIDLSPLQGLHRMRGVGSVIFNIVSCLPENTKNNTFVFYMLPLSDGVINPLDGLELREMKYEVRTFSVVPRRSSLRLPGKLGLFNKAVNQIISIVEFRIGQNKIVTKDMKDLDAFIQIDPTIPLPKIPRGVIKSVMIHDIIPYKIEWDYLWSFGTARKNGMGYKASLKLALRRKLYKTKMQAITKCADLILCNSLATKDDFLNEFRTNNDKVVPTILGVDLVQKFKSTMPESHYIDTSWGFLRQNLTSSLSKEDFILFVGGGDKRRKLQDLVGAFNILRSRNHNLKLVLAGDTAMGPTSIDNPDITQSLTRCSYIEDVIFLGYVSRQELAWLYGHTVAFVFPSRYEGFGLPVLEAMSHGAPVITYNNAAVSEVAGDSALYANDSLSIASSIVSLIEDPLLQAEMIDRGRARSEKYTWQQTATAILDNVHLKYQSRKVQK